MEDPIIKSANKTKFTFILPDSLFDIYMQQIKNFPDLCENEKFIDNLIKLVKLQNELLDKSNKED